MNETRLPSLSAAATYSVSVPVDTFWYSLAASIQANLRPHLFHTLCRVKISHRHFHKIAVGKWRSRSANASFFASIIKCSASALCGPSALEIEAFENLQHLQRDESLRGRRHLVNIKAAIVGGDRLDPIRTMIGKIFDRKKSAELFGAAHKLSWRFRLGKNNPRLPRQSASASPPCAGF